MDEVKKMLRAVINGQSALKGELLKRIDKLDQKIDGVDNKVDKLDQKIDGVEERLTKRIDKIGKSVAFLEDDTPTRDEFVKLEETVEKVVTKTASL